MNARGYLDWRLKARSNLFVLSQSSKNNISNLTEIAQKTQDFFRFVPHNQESVLPHKLCIQLHMSLCPFCPCNIGKDPSYIATFRGE